MRSYRKRQILKVYKMSVYPYKVVLDGDELRFEKSLSYDVRNRAYCSILNHLNSDEEVLETLKKAVSQME